MCVDTSDWEAGIPVLRFFRFLSQGVSTSSSRSRQLSVAVIIVGYFVVMLDATIVNVSLADIGRDMGASVNLLQWVVNAYTLVFAALLLGGGTACDRFGAKRVYLIGLAVFAVKSF